MIYYREKPEVLKKSEEHEAALALLSDGLQEEYGIHTLPVILRGEKGKPYFSERTDIFFNYSHTKHFIACGISDSEIGVDIEEIRPVKESLIHYICHENEEPWVLEGEEPSRRMIMLWTMKEAYVKYHGTGIGHQMKELDMSLLLKKDGNGVFEGKNMQVAKIGNAYLSVYSDKINKVLHI